MKKLIFRNLKFGIGNLLPESKAEKIIAFQKDKKKLKLALIRSEKKKFFLDNYAEYEISGQGEEDIAAHIKKFVSDNDAVSLRTVCFLPLSSVYIRKLVFPYKKLSKIRKSIRFAIEPHIPVSIESTEVFFRSVYPQKKKHKDIRSGILKKIVDFYRDRSREVMAFVVPQALLAEQKEIINAAGLNCSDIYLTPLAVFNFFVSNVQVDENILWIDTGSDRMNIFHVSDGGRLIDLREISAGRDNFGEEKDSIIREINMLLLSHNAGSSGDKISAVYVSGSLEICDLLANSFDVPVKPVDFDDILTLDRDRFGSIPQLFYAGAGKDAGSGGKKGVFMVNFSPPVLDEREKKGMVVGFSLVLVILLALGFRVQFERSIYSRRLNSLNSRMKEIFIKAFPGAEDTRTPLLYMKSMVNSLKSNTGSESASSGNLSALEALKEVSQKISASMNVELSSFRIKDNAVTISGSAPSYQDIDKIKEALEASPLFSGVSIESAKTTDKGVDFRLKIAARK